MGKALRNTLRNVVTQCRKELKKSVSEMLEGQFGVYAFKYEWSSIGKQLRAKGSVQC